MADLADPIAVQNTRLRTVDFNALTTKLGVNLPSLNSAPRQLKYDKHNAD